MPETEQNIQEQTARVRASIVDKFGAKYSEEPMVKVGDYYFYSDALGGAGDLFGSLYFGEDQMSRRSKFLTSNKETLAEFARIFSRYHVKQEDITGIGVWGSVLYVSLSHGKEGQDQHEKPTSIKILCFDHDLTLDGKTYFNVEGGDAEKFGIKVIDEGIQRQVLDTQEENVVTSETKPDSFLIDKIHDRLRRREHQFSDRGIKNVWLEKLATLSGWLKKQDSKSSLRPDEWIFLVLKEMDLIALKPDVVLERKKSDSFFSPEARLLDVSLTKVTDFIHIRERFKEDKKSLERAMDSDSRQLWLSIENILIEGDENIYIPIPESTAVLPAIYLLVQWMAQYYSPGEEMAKRDLVTYWDRIKPVNLKDIKEIQGEKAAFILPEVSDLDDKITPEAKIITQAFPKNYCIIDIFDQKIIRPHTTSP